MKAASRAACDDFALDFAGVFDRRDWQRHRVKDTKCAVSWNQDDGPHSQECTLVDIGGGGVAILVSKVPPRGRLLSLRLLSLDKLSVDGRMVDCQLNRRPGMHLLRIRFVMECPAPLFERAIHGLMPG
ncbi:MAG: PilZ domain-containing protein [Isosphaeraceae bacterium]